MSEWSTVRLWSLHPRYLDRAGLVACWRESLLAQSVLDDPSRGYGHHPQLLRFRRASEPATALHRYLEGLFDESVTRGYRFDRGRIRLATEPDPRGASTGPDSAATGSAAPILTGAATVPASAVLTVTSGQLAFERHHLLAKLDARDPEAAERLRAEPHPRPHPLFRVESGAVAEWERVAPSMLKREGERRTTEDLREGNDEHTR